MPAMQPKYFVEKANGHIFLLMQPSSVAAIRANGDSVDIKNLAIYDYSGQLCHGAVVGLPDGMQALIYEEDGRRRVIVRKNITLLRASEGEIADFLESFSKSAKKELLYVFGRHAKPSAALDEIFQPDKVSRFF